MCYKSSSGDLKKEDTSDSLLASDVSLTEIDEQFQAIADRFTTLDEVTREVRSIVNVDCGLIFGKLHVHVLPHNIKMHSGVR